MYVVRDKIYVRIDPSETQDKTQKQILSWNTQNINKNKSVLIWNIDNDAKNEGF